MKIDETQRARRDENYNKSERTKMRNILLTVYIKNAPTYLSNKSFILEMKNDEEKEFSIVFRVWGSATCCVIVWVNAWPMNLIQGSRESH